MSFKPVGIRLERKKDASLLNWNLKRPRPAETICVSVPGGSLPCVRKGDRVQVGQKIIEPQGPEDVAAYSGIEGVVEKITIFQNVLGKESVGVKIRRQGEPKITLEELKALPGAVWVSKKGTRYEKYKEVIPAEKLADSIAENSIVYSKKKDGTKDKQIGMVKEDGTAVRGFFTPSGKIEFYSETFAKKSDALGRPVDPLPVYEPRDWQPDADYPLYLINWKEASHTHTRTQNNALLLELKPDNPLMINIATAKALALSDGNPVWVESKYGKVKAKVKVTEGIHPEVVGSQHGFGHWALGSLAKGAGTSDTVLRPCKADPLSGQALHKECCVKVYKA